MEHETRHKPGRYIALQIAGRYYAIWSESIREMMPMPELFNFENAMPGMIGFSHVQGTRIPVFDLHPRLEPGKGRLLKFTSQTRLLIAEVHGVKTGFLADRLTDMIQARAHEMKKETIYGHGRPKLIVVLEELWPRTELAELAA